MKRFIPTAGLPLLLVAAALVPAASGCGDDETSSAAPARARTWTASTPRPPTACCGSRSRWGRGRPARASRGAWPRGSGGCSRRAATRRCPAASATWSGACRAGKRVRGARRALRHEGHSRLRGRQRRRLGHGRRGAAGPHDPPAQPPAYRRRSCSSTARRARAARRTRCSPRRASGAARSPPAATGTRGRWCSSTSLATGGCASRARASRTPSSGGASAPRRGGWAPAGAFPAETGGSLLDDHLPFLEQGVPVDRPDRLRLRLLPPALRRPLGRLRAQPRRHGGDRAQAAR